MVFLPKHTNQKLFVKELESRDIVVDTINFDAEIIYCEYKWHSEVVIDRYSTLHSHNTVLLASDKFMTKNLLQCNGISTPLWNIFDYGQIDEILAYIEDTIKYPVVIKPNWGSHWDDVYINIKTQQECRNILLKYASQKHMTCLVEQYVVWKEYRIFITQNKEIACVLREPAAIYWDWIHTIKELIEIVNQERQSRTHYAHYPIIPDYDYLSSIWYKEDSIIENNTMIYVRLNSNIATWGDTYDVTENIHPYIKEIAYKTLKSFPWMMYAGIDLITSDISQDPHQNWYSIIEVNSNPSFSIHMLPKYWKSHNVAKMIVDMLFPETKNSI